MPSGSKKRKAAKKKKENHPSHQQDPSSLASDHQSHGSDDVKHQEVSSPASSQDPHTYQMGGEEEVIHGEKTARDALSKDVSKNVVPIEDEETTKRSYGGDSSRSSSGGGSSSSSSDDESHGVKSNQAVEDIAPVVADSLSETKAKTGNNVVIEDAVAGKTVVQNVAAAVHDRVEVTEETKEEKLNFFEGKVGISTIANDTPVLEPEKEASIQSIEKIATVSDPKENLSQATDGHLIMSYNVPVVAPENGADNNARDSGVSEPVVRANPHPVQTTSWKSCCGLFEVFAGSSR